MPPVRFRSALALAPLFLACLTLSCASDPPCDSGTEKWLSGSCEPPSNVHLNTVGFLPDYKKLASVLTSNAGSFSVKKMDGTSAFDGTLSEPVTDPDAATCLKSCSWTTVRIADFSQFHETGEFYLDVPGVGRSVNFRIDNNVYADVTKSLMLGLYGQRCGQEVRLKDSQGNEFSHGACHTHDAVPWEAQDKTVDVTGGWHDAGDYGKYTNNAAFALGHIFRAWEQFKGKLTGLELQIPERGGSIPDFLDEAKYQLDQLLKMQREDGSAYQQVSGVAFESFVGPTSDVATRYVFGHGTVQAAMVTAVAAAGARIFEPFDSAYAAKCLDVAKKGWQYLKDNPKFVAADMTGTADGHRGYGRGNDRGERMWAAAEMWATTGDADALAAFEATAPNQTVATSWDWADVINLGVFAYVMAEREGRNADLLAQLTKNTISAADTIAADAAGHPYGRGANGYWWGINGTVARMTINLMVANKLQPKPEYVDAVVSQLDHLLGRSLYGRSFVTGLGHFPPIHPHHRPSMSAAWPGLLVGGANGGPDAWKDAQDVYDQNEIAINWNAAMAFGAAALVQ